MTTEIIIESVRYVTSSSQFWGSMGFTTAIAMFVGALLYDGELTQAKKGILSLLSYAVMLSWVTLSRVIESMSKPDFNLQQHPEYAPAGMITIILITLFWILGVLLGVATFTGFFRGKHRPKMI